jgi:hypothetical protein
MTVTTVPAPHNRHLVTYVIATVVALTLVLAVLVGFSIADSDSSPAVGRTGSEAGQELPAHLSDGTPDALERRALNDPARYGSPDAAEEWNR